VIASFLDKIRAYDFALYRFFYKDTSTNLCLEYFYYFFTRYGILIPFLAFIYLIWTKKINALICSGFALFLAGAVDLIIYIIWKRPRPYISHASLASDIETAKFSVDSASFPSSHTYIAFAIATSIFLYGHKKLGAALFLVAICVAIGRIGTGLHYPSDVIGGALLGIASGIIAYLVVHRAEKSWD
jgi:undecaprenyl-diphosphatase